MRYFEKLSSKDIRSRVAKIINYNLGTPPSKISDNTSFSKDLSMNELDEAEFLLGLEKEFKTTIPDKDFYKFKTVGNTVKYLSNNRSNL